MCIRDSINVDENPVGVLSVTDKQDGSCLLYTSTVAAPIKFVFTAGEMTVSIQEILNKIMPTLVPMLVTVGCWLLADKKGWSGNKLILGILGLAAVMVLLGIM